MQEAYACVLAKPRLVRGDGVGYLLTTLRNLYLTQRRREARRRTEPAAPEQLESIAGCGPGDPQRSAELTEICGAIAALPAPFRDAVAAVDIAGLSYQDAADVLDVPVGTVMSRLFRGRRQAARALGAGAEELGGLLPARGAERPLTGAWSRRRAS